VWRKLNTTLPSTPAAPQPNLLYVYGVMPTKQSLSMLYELYSEIKARCIHEGQIVLYSDKGQWLPTRKRWCQCQSNKQNVEVASCVPRHITIRLGWDMKLNLREACDEKQTYHSVNISARYCMFHDAEHNGISTYLWYSEYFILKDFTGEEIRSQDCILINRNIFVIFSCSNVIQQRCLSYPYTGL
jgi:hypothetical protein